MNPNQAIQFLPQIGPEAWAIYCYLVGMTNGNNQCSPSYEMIMAATGLARPTVSKHLPRLYSAGLITPQRRFSASTVYTISIISTQCELTAPLTTTIKESIDKSAISTQHELMGDIKHFRDDYEEAFYIFAQVTGFMAFNSQSEKTDIKRIEAVAKKYGVDGSIEYLKPYFAAWCERRSNATGKQYNRTTTGWLDWAIGGEIPAESKPQKQHNDASDRLGV